MTERKPKKVLIAEDEEDIAKTLQIAFEADGYEVKLAKNGKIALEEVQKDQPDLVIADILMPMMNGFKLCETIKSDNKLSHIPVVLLTAVYRKEQHAEMGLKMGADAYFSKPFVIERLLEVAKKLTNQNIG